MDTSLFSFPEIWYNILGATRYGRGCPNERRGDNFFAPSREGVSRMVTYEGLFAFCLVLLGVAELIFQFYNKKK